jgi:NADPH:quinone reductase-like Zn-dependent oxidoreductase
MKANRIHRFGPPDVIVFDEVERPEPGEGEVLVRVKATGVGPWDGWIRSGKSVINQPLPVTLGSDLSGVVEATGRGVTRCQPGDEVFGVTNANFIGANAEYALASAGMIAAKPRKLGHIEAASMPVVAVTAWQMLFEHARVAPGQTVLIHGAAGNVGAFAVQLARLVRARVIANASARDIDYVNGLDADEVIDFRADRFEDGLEPVDVVIDTVGGDVQRRSLSVLKPGGTLVSAVSEPDAQEAELRGVRAIFFLVKVTTSALAKIAAMVDAGELVANVGVVLALDEARKAHEMMEGLWSRPRGKIVLKGLA